MLYKKHFSLIFLLEIFKMQLTQEQIEFLDKVCGGKWTLNSNGEVDVDWYVDLSSKNLTKIPVKFGKVHDFYIFNNSLTTLENYPNVIKNKNNSVYFYGNPPLSNYFKNIKEEDFKHWDKLDWDIALDEFPILIRFAKNYVSKEEFMNLINQYPKTKLYLK